MRRFGDICLSVFPHRVNAGEAAVRTQCITYSTGFRVGQMPSCMRPPFVRAAVAFFCTATLLQDKTLRDAKNKPRAWNRIFEVFEAW
jgi:hypothetical protein